MKRFYRQVFSDGETGRFCALCAACGKRMQAGRLPLLCRNGALRARYAAGAVGGMRQKLYDLSFARAARHLARYFNRCPACGAWVCDDCFDLADGYGACKSCAERSIGAAGRKVQRKGSEGTR
ncbi:MAG: hypothetical protein VB092_04120 [Oscillospiraceae bacterium]|nr:hypothetical protein [Oscillospiraceae bacterium]